MVGSINRVGLMVLFAALMLAATGCSVFISTPRVARIRIQDLDNQYIEYVVNIDNPAEHDVGIPLTGHYTLQLDFEWLWNMMDKQPEVYVAPNPVSDDGQLTPWMLCKYRF
jgi:hypothetical protein